MAQQTTEHCQRPSEILTLLVDAAPGDVLLVNGDETRWELATKEQPEGVTTRAVFHRRDTDPRAGDYDWRDDPRLIVEYVRARYGPVRHPTYTVRQVGEGVLESGDVTALRDPSEPEGRWTAVPDRDAEPLARLPVENRDGDVVVFALGDELIQRALTGDPDIEYRRVTVSDLFHRDGTWRVEVEWGNDRRRSTAAEAAAALHAPSGGLRWEAPAEMPDDAMVWFPDLEGGDTRTQ